MSTGTTTGKRPARFTIIGENIHTTRAVQRKGARVKVLEDGREAVRFRGEDGTVRWLTVPDWYLKTQPYQQGQVKQHMIAVRKGISGNNADEEEGIAFVNYEAKRQIEAGASYLDLNVDEVSYNLDTQKTAMRWLVGVAQQASTVPLSIDSSNSEIIAEGLKVYDRQAGRPMLNSAALERLDTLDMAKEYDAEVIVTSSGREGMPSDDEERVANVSELIGEAQKRGIPLADIHVDPLVFPISVDPRYGRHFLDAVAAIRKKYGPDIHITGGLSNVSFGIPMRKLVNQAFIALAIDEGLDGAIMDPVQSDLEGILTLDRTTEAYRLASEMLLGQDEYCVNYIQAWRDGKLGKTADKAEA